MASKLKLDEAYLQICQTWSKLSTAKRKQVGCIIVKNGAIISDGYNGTPQGFDNSCEYEDENGDLQEGHLDGMMSRIFQHEFDHTLGRHFTEHASDLKLERAYKKAEKQMKIYRKQQEQLARKRK